MGIWYRNRLFKKIKMLMGSEIFGQILTGKEKIKRELTAVCTKWGWIVCGEFDDFVKNKDKNASYLCTSLAVRDLKNSNFWNLEIIGFSAKLNESGWGWKGTWTIFKLSNEKWRWSLLFGVTLVGIWNGITLKSPCCQKEIVQCYSKSLCKKMRNMIGVLKNGWRRMLLRWCQRWWTRF